MSSFAFPPALFDLRLLHQGKVRDTFEIPGHPEYLLVVATDRVSTHNVVHLSRIPGKGHTLTALTVYLMAEVLQGIKTHLVAYGRSIYRFLPNGTYPDDLHLRAVVVRRLTMFPAEFIFRSRMAGSLLKDYYSKGLPDPYGLELPAGLELMSPFAETMFTPTDKSETDDPLDALETATHYSDAYLLALQVYETGREFAYARGIEIIDGKFELGTDSHGDLVLGDECLTPDCCRFVRADQAIVGREPPWLDKQYLRETAEGLWAGGPKVPLEFPRAVIDGTVVRYEEIAEALLGQPLTQFQTDVLSQDQPANILP